MADKKYLDLTGLGQYDAKIKALIDEKDGAAVASAKEYADSLATNYDAAGSATSALNSAKAYTDDKATALTSQITAAKAQADKGVNDAATAKSAADAAQADVDKLEIYVGTIPEDAASDNIVAYIDEKTAHIATDDALSTLTSRVTAAEGKITAAEGEIDTLQTDMDAVEAKAAANQAAIATLNGEGAGSVKKQIDDAFNEFAANVTDDGVVNTYKELIDYCATHSSEAAEMAGNISKNAAAIKELETFVGELPEGTSAATVIDYVNEKVAEEQARAQKAESALDTRLDVVEEKLGEGGSVADMIDAAKQEAITTATATASSDATTKANQALADAKSYTDGAIDGVEALVSANSSAIDAVEADITTINGKISTLEGASHTHTNKDVLDGINAGKVADWDGAVAKSHEHTNKAVLDGITSGKITTWDNSVTTSNAYTDSKVNEFVAISTSEIEGLF